MTPELPWLGDHFAVHLDDSFAGNPLADIESIRESFEAAVDRAIAGARCVVVEVSGGIDSLAVVLAAERWCERFAGELHAVTIDLVDDEGVPASVATRALLAAANVKCIHHVLEPDFGSPAGDLAWDPIAPYVTAVPRLIHSTMDHAKSLGADVILNGVGGDEVLMSHHFMSSSIARARRWTRCWAYLRDIAKYDPVGGVIAEVLASSTAALPARTESQLYFALHAPQCAASPISLLREPFRSYVIGWTSRWFRLASKIAADYRLNWTQRVLWELVAQYRRPFIEHGKIAVRSPFLDNDFVAHSLTVPIEDRYDEIKRSPYHRFKALNMELLPPEVHTTFPVDKQLFTRTLTSELGPCNATEVPALVDVGIVEANAVNTACKDLRVAPRLRALELWVRGALDAGGQPTEEVGSESVGGWLPYADDREPQ